ncbi:MAG: sulfotransferase family 2 domain-containing protein [Hyphomonadaceae bacterium]
MLSPTQSASLARIAARQRNLESVLDQSLVSRAFPYLFYFVPKCACTTLKVQLWRAELRAGGAAAPMAREEDVHLEQHGPHAPWERRGEDKLARLVEGGEGLFWFTFVRNPFARVYSAYRWLVVDGSAQVRAEHLGPLGWQAPQPPSFLTFLELIAAQPPAARDRHWAAVTDFMPLNDIGFDFIGAVEHLRDDLPVVMRRIFRTDHHIDPALHMYRSSGSWAAALDAMSPAALDLIRELYCADFEAFGYALDPRELAPDRAYLRQVERRGGVSGAFRQDAADWRARNNGPDASAIAVIERRIPGADLDAIKGLSLRNAEMPDWWRAGNSQLWTRPGAPLPAIQPHDDAQPPANALVVLAGEAGPATIVLWGDEPAVVVGRESRLTGALLICGGGASIYAGPNTNAAANAVIDARNGADIFIGGDQLWFADVRLTSDGLHAIRDLATGERINPYGGAIRIGAHVWLGHGVHVHGGVTIGDDVVVAERAVVSGDLPANTLCAGAPAQPIRHGVTWTWANDP